MTTDVEKRTQPLLVEIRIDGHLDSDWTDWFDGLAITPLNNGETVLRGRVADQAALFGMLQKIHHLGLPLLLVKRVKA